MRKRAAFITIGESPRPDILDEMRPWWSRTDTILEVDELGALDGLSEADVTALAPANGEERLVSRRRDGSEVLLRADWIHDRVAELVAACDDDAYDFIVLLCTGKFESLSTSLLLVKAQAIVDQGISAFAQASSRIGVLVPVPEQQSGFDFTSSHASPYSGDRFEAAARELEGADLIVMHCMGYTEPMRSRVATLTGKPVLLARRMVAAAVAQLV